MLAAMRRIWKDEAGVTAIEYGLIASAVVGAIAIVLTTIGQDLTNSFSLIASDL